ncbi:hypothetical protein CL1_0105 [Thermococcus cleftensis]|uniref:DUF4870 domain-containing protein n=1 Tax=Thermococcus cleftensis (strain DSM 27260 / KACC 17922 / CL1) TaxID=163003 RepID=I3ZRI6_THECF|nr:MULTISPECIES: DUF4870 domain-containing protein [Thermococcus]AFL94320.1 hypothetical protein CL1_0105 [Thermococcus cleftensis]NJE03331.1 DUF4870 domain-containing protein [Thermococcus sp. MV11]
MSEAPRGEPKKTSLGLDENVEGMLAYLVWWVTGIVFLVLEKESDFVRFHAMQSLITFIGITVLQVIFGFIPYIGGIISWLLWILGLALWILGMVKAYQGERYKFPVVGDLAEEWVGKVNV